ncbi:MAG: nicotinate-nucleotide--dimethylbenzimidazole phosphoribosyltransferase [Candidatus Thermoplasmatota archaeon]|nr:nicotinate-nucleotide--dimethylbenzimidazole phosphoribosyltransferase [Candidatus Thermoplasmatota archaeon]
MNRKPDINLIIAGNTQISLIPGITSAGQTPDLTFLTPALDSEILVEGECKSLDVPPMTPDGLPTPSLIARACLDISGLETLVVDGGMGIKPKCAYLHTHLNPARDGRKEMALPQASLAVSTGRYIGKTLLKNGRSIMISESIPGGTTTAQSVLSLLGLDIKTSSSFRINPTNLKSDVIEEMIQRHGIQNDPLKSISRVGDYTQEIALGIISENEDSKIVLSGGTQMATIYYIASSMKLPVDNLEVWTTKQVMKDSRKTMEYLVDPDHLRFSRTDLTKSRFDGIRRFEDGYVKEGAGMGGSMVLAEMEASTERIIKSIDDVYESFM